MRKFEHDKVIIPAEALDTALKTAGNEGWELVALMPVMQASPVIGQQPQQGLMLVFKREVPVATIIEHRNGTLQTAAS